jgi:membrane protease YdiL (CAAX protease family)
MKGIKLKKIFLLILSGWLLSIVFSSFQLLNIFRNNTNLSLILIGFLEFIFIVPSLIYFYKNDYSYKKYFKLNNISNKILFPLVVFSIGVFILSVAIDMLRWNDVYSFLIIIISVVVIAPIIEEMIFRGLLLRGLEKKYESVVLSVIYSSILFAVIHVLPSFFIQIFLIGMILGFLSIKFNSIFPGIVLHSINNLLTLLLLNLNGNYFDFYLKNDFVNWKMVIVGGILIYFGFRKIKSYITSEKLKKGK